MREYRARNRAFIEEKRRARVATSRNFVRAFLANHPCVDCSESDIVVLEFDHVRGTKAFNIAYLVGQGRDLQTIKTEMDKCEVRCANCHRRKTAKQFGWA